MDEKKREDKEFIDGAAVDSSETENGSVTADDLLGKLNSNIGGSKRKSRRERKKKKALEQTRDTTSDFYDLSINDVPDDFDTDAIIRDVMGESEYAKYVAGEGKDSDSDDYDEFVTQFSENVDGRSDSSDEAPAAAASEQPAAAAEPADGAAASDAHAATDAYAVSDAASADTAADADVSGDSGAVAPSPIDCAVTPEDMLADIVASTDGTNVNADADTADATDVDAPADVVTADAVTDGATDDAPASAADASAEDTSGT